MKLALKYDLLRNMGFRYVWFRIKYSFLMRTGILKRRFPYKISSFPYPSISTWKNQKNKFFFNHPNELRDEGKDFCSTKIVENAQKISQGIFPFFSNEWVDCTDHLNNDVDNLVKIDWLYNHKSKKSYTVNKHWTKIKDLDPNMGDIKYVWEKSRFSWLYSIIYSDVFSAKSNDKFVLGTIEDWIDKNPLNYGPNYKCSQEISLRVLNWISALYFYQDSQLLTNPLFQKILHSIRGQMMHVFSNIKFSLISVRNNHAITESLALYIVGMLFPFFPEAKKWKRNGKKWFEKEISYQIYSDGTYLQFSANYHRVVIQLLSWAIRLSELNGVRLKSVIYDRAEKSLDFLLSCMNDRTGWLPNFGANDGALFFPLNDNNFRDYRGQLAALAKIIGKESTLQIKEYQCLDTLWYCGKIMSYSNEQEAVEFPLLKSYDKGGYYICKDASSLTFFRCGKYKDRPSQSDNLHMDLWIEDVNVLMDAGSYLYNATSRELLYFNGFWGHNTASLVHEEHMLKGPRFIWFYWIKKAHGYIKHTKKGIEISGTITAYKHLSSGMKQKRTITKIKDEHKWIIEDYFYKTKGFEVIVNWRINPVMKDDISIKAYNAKRERINPINIKGWQSDYYGNRYHIPIIQYADMTRKIITVISLKSDEVYEDFTDLL